MCGGTVRNVQGGGPSFDENDPGYCAIKCVSIFVGGNRDDRGRMRTRRANRHGRHLPALSGSHAKKYFNYIGQAEDFGGNEERRVKRCDRNGGWKREPI